MDTGRFPKLPTRAVIPDASIQTIFTKQHRQRMKLIRFITGDTTSQTEHTVPAIILMLVTIFMLPHPQESVSVELVYLFVNKRENPAWWGDD